MEQDVNALLSQAAANVAQAQLLLRRTGRTACCDAARELQSWVEAIEGLARPVETATK